MFCKEGDWLTPRNMTRYVAWNGCKQGYKSDENFAKCGAPCMAPDLLSTIDGYNSKHRFKLVTLPSRKGPDGQQVAQLKAWWLPSGEEDAPRVVLQHGNNANFNSRMMIMAAYLLRSIGIDVLVPSLRGHGMSEKGFDKVTWSYEYPFDLLGAWDYVVNDPDGQLGGKRPPSKVGLMGMSMGGYLVSAAFGMEDRIPGIWADGGVFTLSSQIDSLLSFAGPLAYLFAPLVRKFASYLAAGDIAKYSPARVLPNGPSTKRKVAVVTSALDNFVTMAESMQLATMTEENPEKYDLVLKWAPEVDCNGNAHCSTIFALPDEYREKLLSFWNTVFERDTPSSLLSCLPALSTKAQHDGTNEAECVNDGEYVVVDLPPNDDGEEWVKHVEDVEADPSAPLRGRAKVPRAFFPSGLSLSPSVALSLSLLSSRFLILSSLFPLSSLCSLLSLLGPLGEGRGNQ